MYLDCPQTARRSFERGCSEVDMNLFDCDDCGDRLLAGVARLGNGMQPCLASLAGFMRVIRVS